MNTIFFDSPMGDDERGQRIFEDRMCLSSPQNRALAFFELGSEAVCNAIAPPAPTCTRHGRNVARPHAAEQPFLL